MNTTNCPVCHETIEELWSSHIPEDGGYYFPCPHCETDLVARWDWNEHDEQTDDVVLTRDAGDHGWR